MPTWLVWLLVAGLFAGAETASATLVFVMFAGGALAGSIAAALGASIAVQGVIAVLVSIALLAGLRPVLRRHLMRNPLIPSGSDKLVGREAVVLTAVNAYDGRVRLNGGEWSARTDDRQLVLPAGTVVRVVAIEGATAVVTLDPSLGYSSEPGAY